MKSSLKLLILTTLLSATVASAENKEAPWYQIELFVFSQNQDNLMTEHWDETIYPQLRPSAVNIYGESGKRSGIIPLKASNRQIPIAKSLMKRNGYRHLFHQVWKQPIQEKRNARPIRIRGGEALNDSTYELEGDITIDIARYLHLRTNLFYSLKKPANWQSSLVEDLAVEAPVASTALESLTEATALDSSPQQPVTTETEDNLQDPSILTVKMEQGRRMRRDQIHYLDHPMFGLFIQMTRIEAPSASADASPQPLSQPESKESAPLSDQTDSLVTSDSSVTAIQTVTPKNQ